MPNSICDLHLHTYYSDGIASPGEILHHAAEIGLKIVSITDHDSLDAIREATNVAAVLGLELIPGIELTSHWEHCITCYGGRHPTSDVDVLGYYFDWQEAGFRSFVRGAFDDMRSRIDDTCKLLSAAGYPLTILDVLDENPRYAGGRQVINALCNRGYASNWQEAFSLFVTHWPEVRPRHAHIDQVIKAIHTAGGVAILAHPIAVSCKDGLLQVEQIAALVEMGLDGLEVYHPRMDTAARQHFLKLAKQFNLLVSGGSDEHGWHGSFIRMGTELVTIEMVNALRKRSQIHTSQRYPP